MNEVNTYLCNYNRKGLRISIKLSLDFSGNFHLVLNCIHTHVHICADINTYKHVRENMYTFFKISKYYRIPGSSRLYVVTRDPHGCPESYLEEGQAVLVLTLVFVS